MKVLDGFMGTGSMRNTARDLGHDSIGFDFDSQHDPDICDDVLNLRARDLLEFAGWDSVDLVHMSPPCTTFSIASCSTHWYADGRPKSEACKMGLRILRHTLKLIQELNPRYFVIENPRGLMRKQPEMIALSKKYNHACVTYCQYGDTRMKPTDIWGKFPPGLRFKPMCRNGDSCHESAPRGSKTGTQGLGNAVERSRIPRELCETIIKSCDCSGWT